MNKFLISLGSNKDPESNISLCRELLCEMFESIIFSETSVTIPYGDNYKNNFLNQLVFAETDKGRTETTTSLKLLEAQIGRKSEDKTNGEVTIDIDLIKWNNSVLKENEWERDYIAQLIPSIEKAIVDLSQTRK